MIARGRVKGGVVVLEDGGTLREEVAVVTLERGVAELPAGSGNHGVLDIPTVSVGAIRQPLSQDDDLLGEMLESRP
jgi:hypothetical protein